MNSDLRKRAPSLIIWSLVWASAIMATAYFFKGNASQNWIEAGVNVVGIFIFLLLNLRPIAGTR